jgi:hypothetical protein
VLGRWRGVLGRWRGVLGWDWGWCRTGQASVCRLPVRLPARPTVGLAAASVPSVDGARCRKEPVEGSVGVA